MRLGKRVTICFLAALACVNIALRYPGTIHEIGADTFVWHGMATSLQSNGRALWILSPLSYFGLYPLSHPSGSPFLAAAFSDLSFASIEGSIVWLDMTIALLAMLVAFVLGWEFTRSETFALTLATVLSLTPEMVTALYWQMPTRIMFTALLPLLLWGFVRLGKGASRPLLFVLASMLFLMMAFHRLTVLALLVPIAYVVTGIFLTLLRTLRLRNPQVFLHPVFVRRAPYLGLVGLAALALGTLFFANVLGEYSVGAFATGDSLSVRLLNLGVSLARSSGVLLPLAVLGVVGVAVRRNKSLGEPFIIVSFLTFIPLLFLRQYTGYYTIPFTSLFITFGLFVIGRHIRSRRWRAVGAAATIVFILGSSAAISGYDLRLIPNMTDETYTAALYARYNVPITIVSNEGIIGSRLHAISGVPYLPVGGATTAFQSPELLMFGFLDATSVARNVVQVPIQQLTVESDSFFLLPGVQAQADWVTILGSPVDSRPADYAQYHVGYALESRAFEGAFTAYGNTYPALLLQTAHDDRYVIYESDSFRLFYVGS